VIAQVGLALSAFDRLRIDVRTYQTLITWIPLPDPEQCSMTHIVIPRGPTFDAQTGGTRLRQMVEAAEALRESRLRLMRVLPAGKWFHYIIISIWWIHHRRPASRPTPGEVHLLDSSRRSRAPPSRAGPGMDGHHATVALVLGKPG